MAKKTFTNLPTKITSVVNKVAPLLGTAHGILGDPMGDGRGLEGAPAFIMGAIKEWKIANPIFTTELAMSFPDRYPIIPGIIAAAVGYGIKEVADAVDIKGKGAIKNMGSALMGYGTAAAITSVVAAWIWLARFNPHGETSRGQPRATTSGRVPYARKHMATYPTDGTGTWTKPR